MKIGFIGCGNMGGALASAVISADCGTVYVSDYNKEKAKEFAVSHGASVSDNKAIAKECDVIFLAVKPNVYPSVLDGIKGELADNRGSVIVSMAAGVSIDKVAAMISDTEHPIIRIMPNTPCSVGYGMILWCANSATDENGKAAFSKMLAKAGRLDMIDEKLIDAASAVSGCGPAFVYMFIEAISDGAVECGLPRDKAMLYAAETLIGAAEMVKLSGKHPGLLKDEVCSPGGSTIEGVHALEDGAFRATTASAVIAAYNKTKILGK